MSQTPLIAPGQWLGILGGGQLGRMFCHAAQVLGYRVAVLDPDASSPAGAVADRHLRASYTDEAALDELAALCAAVTTEFENVPADSLRRLAAAGRRVGPSGQAVAVTQDRIAEKAFVASLGIAVAPHKAIHSASDLDSASGQLFPGILKLARLGYDGKGQVLVDSVDDARQAFASLGGAPCVLEARLSLAYEISVVVARGFDGQSTAFPVSRNEHRGGILAVSCAPAPALPDRVADEVARIGRAIALGLDYHGVMCVEFFVLTDGSLVVNEMAPRPHNSGHYTIEACMSSQFAQQARVLAGLPLGAPDALAPSVMLNVLGDVWFDGDARREPDWAAVARVPGACLHLYGKEEPRPGRKMGHVTCVAPTLAQAWDAARQVGQALGITLDAQAPT